MTPHRFLIDIYNEFVEDLTAAGIGEQEVCTRQWFCYIWNYHPQLSHVTIASGKENFGRCTKCQEAEERIGKARKGSDTQELLYAKQDRLDHLMEERADKLSYYAARVAARQPATDMVSAIIDKMDGAKNMCPRCVLTVEPICMQHTSPMFNITPHLWITVSCATPRRPTRS